MIGDRYQALLKVAQLIGLLERRIKLGLKEASDDELLSNERMLWYRAKEIATQGEAKTVSLGRLANILANHPFNKLLTAERLRRLDDNEGLGEMKGMTDQQIRDYLIRKSERQSNSPRKSLPVLPRGKR